MKFCEQPYLVAFLFATTTVSACAEKEFVVTDFSQVIQLESSAKKGKVVGLHLNTKLSKGTDVILNVGCNGAVYQRIVIPPDSITERRIDWYTNCAEISFEPNSNVGRSLRLSYRFQEM